MERRSCWFWYQAQPLLPQLARWPYWWHSQSNSFRSQKHHLLQQWGLQCVPLGRLCGLVRAELLPTRLPRSKPLGLVRQMEPKGLCCCRCRRYYMRKRRFVYMYVSDHLLVSYPSQWMWLGSRHVHQLEVLTLVVRDPHSKVRCLIR